MSLATSAKRVILVGLVAGPIHFLAAQSTLEYLAPGKAEPDNAVDPSLPIHATLYYNNIWELTSQEKSVYRRETSLDFVNMVYTGVFKDFTRDNKRIADGYYDEGVKRGLHSEYFEDGTLKSTIEYGEKEFIIWELTNDQKENEITHGTGKFKSNYYSFEEVDHTVKLHEGTLTGEFVNGKRNGAWAYRNTDNTITDDEIYLNGFFSKRIAFTPSGLVDHHDQKSIYLSLNSLVVEAFNFEGSTYTQLSQYFEQNPPAYPPSFNRNVSFPGGLKKLLLLIALNMQLGIEDPVLMKMTVNEHGHLEKIKGPLVVGKSTLEDEVTRVMKPYQFKLLPAIKDGKPVATTLLIPVCSSQDWIEYLRNGSQADVNSYVEEVNQK